MVVANPEVEVVVVYVALAIVVVVVVVVVYCCPCRRNICRSLYLYFSHVMYLLLLSDGATLIVRVVEVCIAVVCNLVECCLS